jgi:O-antigen/teichoic acid export membrane protein
VSDDVRSNAELTEAVSSGLRWIVLARVAIELLLFGSLVILARLMPPSAFGMFAVVVIAQELAVTVPGEGIGSALVQRREITRKHLQGGFTLSLLVGAGLAAITILLSATLIPWLLGGETADLVMLATPYFLLGAIFALPMAVLRRKLDFRRVSMLDLTQSGMRSLACIFFATVFALDAPALVLGGLVAMTSTLIVALLFAPVPLPRWRWREMRDLLPYGGPAALACVSWTGFRNGDYAVISGSLGAAQAGFYWRGYQLAVEYQRKISSVMTQVTFPMLSRTAGAKEMFELRGRVVRLLTVTIFPLLVMLILLAPVLVPWLFGSAWEAAVLPTQILAGAGAASVVIDVVGSVLMAEGRTKALLGYGVAHFVVYIGAVIVVAPLGLVAVSATAVVVHTLFLFVAYELLLRTHTETALRLLWEDVSAASVACLALLVAAGSVDWALQSTSVAALPEMAIVAASGGIAYLTALRFWFPAASRDLATLFARTLPSWRLPSFLRRDPAIAEPPSA